MDTAATIEKDNSNLTWTARIVSVVFHPIWLPLVFAAWKAWGDPLLPRLLLVIFGCIVAFPGAVALLWMWIRTETDWFVMSQGNRLVPMVATLIGLAFFAVANGGLLPERLFQGQLMATLILLVFISILVNLFWKISVHLISWGAVTSFCCWNAMQGGSWVIFAVTIPLALLIAWARIRVGSHDKAQVIVGWFSGIVAAAGIVLAFP